MSTRAESSRQKKADINIVGLTLDDYKGAVSTLCKGCGHDAITSSIIKALFELGVEPHRVAKLSGIGCSSKTTNYFLNQSHGFNAVHGRMAAIATGVAVANRKLINLGVSGDGDTASIGLSHFAHMVRRNVPMVYIIENNGCYGLTKGQFSATADKGSVKKGGQVNAMLPVDCCALALNMGCGFVARTFSGDAKQVRTLLKAALSYRGTAVLDIVSPCVTFNNHEGSTKSIAYARSNESPLHDLDFIPYFEPITVQYDEGTTKVVEMHDGSKITLSKLTDQYDASDRVKALALLEKAREEMLFYTGLIYCDRNLLPIQDQLNMIAEPLVDLPEDKLRPSNQAFEEIMATFR
jgi:2-oxoglutarate/2-oxoacid ferredoxin oxidoreductase subunit beta